MAANTSTTFLSKLHDDVNRYFSLEEIRTLCFDLGADYDSIPGEGKPAKTRELILGMVRQGRLPGLLALLTKERPHVAWGPLPPDFELPGSGPWAATPQPAQQINVQGDYVHGDKTGGDKVSGDKISVGDISGSSGVAIGRGAQAKVNTGDTFNMSGDFRGAVLNIKSTLNNVQQTIGGMATLHDAEKEELQSLVKQLEQALTQVPEAHDEDAEAVSKTTEALVNLAAEEKPNKTMLQITGEGLKQAAKNLAEITPDVLTIATGIVMTIGKIAGL